METKTRHARKFIEEGDKVKISCTFRGREMAHPEIGEKLVRKFCSDLEDIATVEAPPKLLGRILGAVLAPGAKKKKDVSKPEAQEQG
jgi:translation initiation factor IF-3